MAIFPKFFGDTIILIIRVNADERTKKNSDIFSIKNVEYTFVCFLSIQSLGQKFVKFFVVCLENLRHKKDILRLTDL